MTDIPVLAIHHLRKAYGPVAALDGVDITFQAGRVHTLLGENGAGKSTLIRILAGLTKPDSGTIEMNGTLYAPSSRDAAILAGVAVVFQELSLSANLTVAQNIFAGHEPRRLGFVDSRRLNKAAATLLDELGFKITVTTPVTRLSLAQRQLVEIAKALSFPARIVIMDEPTSSLSDHEAEQLFRIIASLKAQGVAIIYVSHRMGELMRLSDDITVMRDGLTIRTLPRSDASIPSLIEMMVGREISQVFPTRKPPSAEGTPRLEVHDLTVSGEFQKARFAVARGEILGFFGLVGAGRSELMRAIAGHTAHRSGTVRLDEKQLPAGQPLEAIRRGMAFVTENRKKEGLVLDHSIAANIASVHHIALANGFMPAAPRAEAITAKNEARRLGVKAHSLNDPTRSLSGGNQQKVVLAKWLAARPKVLILDEPTRGIDVGAKVEIYRIIHALADEGTSILLVSSELPEVMGLSDRLAIMREGEIVAIHPVEALTPATALSLAAGITSPEDTTVSFAPPAESGQEGPYVS